MRTQQADLHTRFNNKFFETSEFAKTFTDEMQKSIQNCILCHQVCEHTLAYALEKGMKSEHSYLQTLVDCAEMCILAADFMLRNSHLHHITCNACSEICTACADACQALDSDDETLQSCANICLQCSKSCWQMAHAS